MTLYNIVGASTLVGGQAEDVSQVLANFQAIQAILNGAIDDSNISPSANLTKTKIAGYPWHDGDIAAAAAIAYSKLALTGSIVNADISPAAAIAYSKLATPFAAIAQLIPANPAGNSSDTLPKMMGLSAGGTVITPIGTKLFVTVSGDIYPGTPGGVNPAATSRTRLRYGTGNGPANGAGVVGTVVGNPSGRVVPVTGGASIPFTISGVITGLVPATAVWLDLDLSGDGLHTSLLTNLALQAFDLV